MGAEGLRRRRADADHQTRGAARTDALRRAPTKQLTVRAHLKGGEMRDVTDLTVFSVQHAGAATVTDRLRRVSRPGEVVILGATSSESQRSPAVRSPDPNFVFHGPPPNDVDHHVFAKQKELQLNPAPIARTRSSCDESSSTRSACCRRRTRPVRSSTRRTRTNEPG